MFLSQYFSNLFPSRSKWIPAKAALFCFKAASVLIIAAFIAACVCAFTPDFLARNFTVKNSLLPLTVFSAEIMQMFLLFLCLRMERFWMRDIFLSHTWFFILFTYAVEVFGWICWIKYPSPIFLLALLAEYWIAISFAKHLADVDADMIDNQALATRPKSANTSFLRTGFIFFATLCVICFSPPALPKLVVYALLAISSLFAIAGWMLIGLIPPTPDQSPRTTLDNCSALARNSLSTEIPLGTL